LVTKIVARFGMGTLLEASLHALGKSFLRVQVTFDFRLYVLGLLGEGSFDKLWVF
jgi:hypothetical protein